MNMKLGQRWRWIFTGSSNHSDMIMEVTSVRPCVLQIVQVLKGLGNDRIGVEFLYAMGSTWEYLTGQDKS